MSDNVIEFGASKKTEDKGFTPVYHDYELVLHKLDSDNEPVTIQDYGFLINNGSFYGIGRYFEDGENERRVEFVVIAGVDDVRYARSTGRHYERASGRLDS